MKIRVRNHFVLIFTALLIGLGATVLLRPAFVSAEEYLDQGKDQLVDALDAAFIRVLASGEWQEIMDNDTLGGGELAINVGDCYPNVSEAPFPANPTGLLSDILTSGQIRVGTYESEAMGPGSFEIYEQLNTALLRAIIDELGQGYSLSQPIDIVFVPVWPPSSGKLFTMLNNGDFDITYFNAAIGATATFQGTPQRRRKFARFTCTVFASEWYIHVKNGSSFQTMVDVQADNNTRICSGMLSSRLSKAWFPNQIIIEMQESDLENCSARVDDGTDDAYLYFGPDPYLPGLRAIKTGIVAGVPIWVAGTQDQDYDGIADLQDNCPNIANPGQEDADHDGIGDVCDNCTDTDNDTYGNPGYPNNTCQLDNCPGIDNPGQEDEDEDEIGDACEGITPCEADIHVDGKVSILDLLLMKQEYGRDDCP